MIIIGIDPGLSGGLAAITKNSGAILEITSMPTAGGEVNSSEIASMVRRMSIATGACGLICIYLESVHAMPKQGVSSTFKFGCGWGMIRGVAAALGVSVTLVTPPAWKKEVLSGLPHDKDGAIRYAASRWPDADLVLPGCRKPHDGIADALCIAEYGRRQA